MMIKELTRLNEIARIARSRALTAAEDNERAELRRAYLAPSAATSTPCWPPRPSSTPKGATLPPANCAPRKCTDRTHG